MTFREFLASWLGDNGTLDSDAAWRAYDIPSVPSHHAYIRKALKALGLAYAGELALPEFMARYGLTDRAQAEHALTAWWLWSQIDAGRRVRVPKRAAG